MDGKEVRGYSANNLIHFGYICFTDVINNADHRDEYLALPVETLYAKAYHLSRSFALLNEFAYIHADFKTDNFFISLDDARCALIDFDSGAFIHSLTDEPYTWGTPQDMLAPEIYEQMSKENSMVRVNLLTDMWSVAVATHYLIFSLHPLFFITELSRDAMNEYNSRFTWPDIDFNSPLFNSEMLEIYDWYNQIYPDLPQDIAECFRHTFTEGFFSPDMRTSYEQWIIKLQPLIAEEERRRTFSKLKRIFDNAGAEQEQEYEQLSFPEVSEADFPQYISSLVEKLIDKQAFLYEYQNELEAVGASLGRPSLYSKVDELLCIYYDITNEGAVTPMKRNKFRFKATYLGLTPATIE